jgi:hypothetical protein
MTVSTVWACAIDIPDANATPALTSGMATRGMLSLMENSWAIFSRIESSDPGAKTRGNNERSCRTGESAPRGAPVPPPQK